jgi:D-beta-D-heptose 7-phosphate kinase/D-beta-D-heptose 1-phosphate adenosyltransferase
MKRPKIDPEDPPRVLVIGDLMLDRYLWGSCDRVSPEAPVQVVKVAEETHALGGCGNVLANLVSLGARPQVIALVGRDEANTRLQALLGAIIPDPRGILVDEARPTTVKTRLVAARHQIVRFDVESTAPCSAAHAARLLELADEMIPRSQVVVLSDYGKGLLTDELAAALIACCRRHGVRVLVDPKGQQYGKYAGASLLTPNRKEAALATGSPLATQEQIRAAGFKLCRDHHLDACLITLSEDGMALFTPQGETWLPTVAREVFDVTGAGDTVIAALALGLSTNMSLPEACGLANRAAGVVVGKVGAASVTLDEIDHVYSASARGKIVDLVELEQQVARHRSEGRKVAFTNGCFDLLHAGHVQYLAAAAAMADVLVVGLNSDASVARLKGEGRPLNTERDRATVLAGLSAVDYVTVFSDDTPLSLIERVVPDVLVKGADYEPDQIVGADVVRRAGGRVEVVPLVEGRSTTALVQRARKDVPLA